MNFWFSFFTEQLNSAANLRFVLEWTWNKVIYAKHEFDQIGEYQCSHCAHRKSLFLLELLQSM